jgi:glutathione S-transferase
MDAKLYWFPLSHPSQAVRTMLELKGIDHKLVHVLPGNQRVHLRLAGFRAGTVPALKVDGRRVQGSTVIARELEALRADPPLYPPEPALRGRVEEAERWGDDVLQSVPRRIFRWGLARDASLRQWLAEQDGRLPFAAASSHVTGPVSKYYARIAHADSEQVKHDIEQLPQLLDHIDGLMAEGVLTTAPPNAATLQIMCSVRSLLGMSDFAEQVGARSFAPLARQLFPHFPEAISPPFVERLRAA